MLGFFARISALACITLSVFAVGTSHAVRTITFEDRVRAQEVIERNYYSHQIDAKAPFEEAVPRAALEAKVLRYLRQTAALDRIWKTPVTEAALRAEWDRILKNTRYPDRLVEILSAMGSDEQLFLETLVRATLVDRLSRSFFENDQSIHASARARAEEMREGLLSGSVSTFDRARRFEIVRERDGGSSLEGFPSFDSRSAQQLHLDPEEFSRRAELLPLTEEPGPITETQDSFMVTEVQERDRDRITYVVHSIPKITWEAWERTLEVWPLDTIQTTSETGFVPGPLAIPRAAEASPCAGDNTWIPGLDGPATGRTDHTAVWTGSMMIIWGGNNADVYWITGGRYDPLTDTWSRMTSIGAPGGRIAHSAIWTGTEMIIWGGRRGGVTQSGGRYNPLTDRWRPTSTIGAPSPRELHTAVWTGVEMIIFGGSDSSNAMNTGSRYDPIADVWHPMEVSFQRSVAHTAVWTGQEMLVWGGRDNMGFHGDGGRYDPGNNHWTPIKALPAGQERQEHTAVWANGRMMVWGGRGVGSTPLTFGFSYDPDSDSWETITTSSQPQPRYRHAALWTGSRMIIWGGLRSTGPLATGGSFDPVSRTWTTISTLNAPPARFSPSAVWAGTTAIIWGGSNSDTGHRYDPATDTWTPTSDGGGPAKRESHRAVWTGTRMVIWGGWPGLNSGGQYDPMLDTWTDTTLVGAPSGRLNHSMVWTGREVIVWGGTVAGPMTGGRYNPQLDVWTDVSIQGSPPIQYIHSAVWTGTEMIVWGGLYELATAGGARYDPTTDSWLPISANGAPYPRRNHHAFWTGDRMLVYGGYTGWGAPLNSGALFDPEHDSWTPVGTDSAPVMENPAGAAWTGNEMILWGDCRSGNPTQCQGGRYEPMHDVWTPIATTSGPYTGVTIWVGRELVVWGGAETAGSADSMPSGGLYAPETDTWLPIATAGMPIPSAGSTAVWTGREVIFWNGTRGGRLRLVESPDDDLDTFRVCRGDCEDNDARIHAGAIQVCGDGVNNDCLHPWWPSLQGTNEKDDDRDGLTECSGDCDDARPEAFPGATEVCNLADDNCDTQIDEELDFDLDGFTTCSGDCDDAHSSIRPGGPQICGDGLNNDCSSVNWPALAGTNEMDNDGDLIAGCQGDCDDSRASVYPGAAQVCGDGVNNNCADPSWPVPVDDVDEDSDGLRGCEGDCDDHHSQTFPGAPEVNDALDNQCQGDAGHGLVDEISGPTGFTDGLDQNAFCWLPQESATEYSVLRAGSSRLDDSCALAPATNGSCWSDSAAPALRKFFYYVVHATGPNLGSWGGTSSGLERTPSGCSTVFCGNGIAEAAEVCDGNDVRGESCESLGFDSGALKCNTSCTAFNTSMCQH